MRRVLLAWPIKHFCNYFTEVFRRYVNEFRRVFPNYEFKVLIGDDVNRDRIKSELTEFNPHYCFFLGHGASGAWAGECRKEIFCTPEAEEGCRHDATSRDCVYHCYDPDKLVKLLKDKVCFFLNCCFGLSADYLTTCWPWNCPVGAKGVVSYCDVYYFIDGNCRQLPGLVEVHPYINIGIFTLILKGRNLNKVVEKGRKIFEIFREYVNVVTVPSIYDACLDLLKFSLDKDIKALTAAGSNYPPEPPEEGPSRLDIDFTVNEPVEIPSKELVLNIDIGFNRPVRGPGVLIIWYNLDNWLQDCALHLVSDGSTGVKVRMTMSKLHLRMFGNMEPQGRGTIPKEYWGKKVKKYIEVKAYLIY